MPKRPVLRLDEPDPTSTALAAALGARLGQWIGLTVLALLTCLAAAWLYLQGQHPKFEPPNVPASLVRSYLANFRADAWQLPDEPLLGFVEIPAGSFMMGSDPAIDSMAYANERWSLQSKQGVVEMPSFYIGRYEVTVAQLAAFVAATSYRLDPAVWQSPPDHPATHVSWTDALAYARWLQRSLRAWPGTPAPLQELLRDGWRITLPSEAEWEKAARGPDGRIYPWGNSPETAQANFAGRGTRAVGSIACPSCAYGLADMSGNVWELTRSPFQPYPYDSSDQPRNPDAPALFVMRGGSFSDAANNVRAATRGGIDPGARRGFIGFRLVLTRLASEP